MTMTNRSISLNILHDSQTDRVILEVRNNTMAPVFLFRLPEPPKRKISDLSFIGPNGFLMIEAGLNEELDLSNICIGFKKDPKFLVDDLGGDNE